MMDFGTHYHGAILLDVWLQAAGSLLSVIFALALVHLAGAARRFSGTLVKLAGSVIVGLGLIEGMLELGAIQAATNGHQQGSVYFFDLTNVFVHIFLLAPSLFLTLGLALWGSRLLPRGFAAVALGLGIAFQVLGIAGLFSTTALAMVLIVLIAQEIWTIVAAVRLIMRPQSLSVPVAPTA